MPITRTTTQRLTPIGWVGAILLGLGPGMFLAASADGAVNGLGFFVLPLVTSFGLVMVLVGRSYHTEEIEK